MRSFALCLVGLVAACSGRAYDFIGSYPIRWPAGDVEVVLQLDDTRTPQPLSDGNHSWDAVARQVFARWNSVLPSIQFVPTSGSRRADGNDRNEIFFSSNIYGQRFGRGVLAVTTTWHIGEERVEGDTIFNSALPWDSYPGDLDDELIDFRRVALHEFGHLVGLDHPDQANQVIPAIMNSLLSDLDELTDDDIRGAEALYTPWSTRNELNVVIDPPEAGTVVVNPTTPDQRYSRSTLVSLNPKPARGFRFNYWDAPDPSAARLLKMRLFESQSVTAHFTSNSAPRITAHPKSQFASRYEYVSFRVRAANAPRATFQWYFEGSELPGETNSTLTVESVQHANSGSYQVIVRSAKGETRSKPARLIVDGY